MEPMLPARLDPALLRVIDKRNNEHEAPPRRRRLPVQERPEEQEGAETDTPRHEIDDLA